MNHTAQTRAVRLLDGMTSLHSIQLGSVLLENLVDLGYPGEWGL